MLSLTSLYRRRFQLQKFFLRIKGAKVGELNTFHSWIKIVGNPQNLIIGHSNVFNEQVCLNVREKIEIGDNNHFSVGSKIITTKLSDDLSHHISFPIKIGDNCWLACDSVVAISSSEVTICNNVIIGAKNLVFKSINKPGKYLQVVK
jgi:acetyltransferase-like isoleucine patch superfamily enzyme